MDTENTGREFPGEYRLDLEDFGPIAKASVDLRPLTVFIGPSNTGKSYLAILLYALHRIFSSETNIGMFAREPSYFFELFGSDDVQSINDEGGRSIFEDFRDWLSSETGNKSDINSPDNIKHKSRSTPERRFDRRSLHDLPIALDARIRSVLERAKDFDRYSEREFSRCFSVDDMRSMTRRSSSKTSAKLNLSIPRISDVGTVRYSFYLQDDGVALKGRITGDTTLVNEIKRPINLVGESRYAGELLPWEVADDEYLQYLIVSMTHDIFKASIRPLSRNAYYLPADRTGFVHSYQVITSTLVQSATTAGLGPSMSIPVLSGALADFLSVLIEITAGQKRGRFGSRYDPSHIREPSHISEELAKRLEKSVLQGTVKANDLGNGYSTLAYFPDGWSEPLPLMRASSMVSEIVPVVLYLRYLVRPGDVLIIEEPESHLHPGMQVEFTRQLAGLVRAGIRVIVTTHSEWVLQELANLVRVSGLPESERAGIAGGDVALDPDQVGAWLFKPDEGGEGSKVSEIPLDHESGLYPTDFEDVAVAMHNDWAEIFSRLGED